MPIALISPSDRLPNLQRIGDKSLMVNLAQYQCPHCGALTAFTIESSKPCPFDSQTKATFDAATPKHSLFDTVITDFVCQGCVRPVRVVIHSEEVRMASYLHYAQVVIETAP